MEHGEATCTQICRIRFAYVKHLFVTLRTDLSFQSQSVNSAILASAIELYELRKKGV